MPVRQTDLDKFKISFRIKKYLEKDGGLMYLFQDHQSAYRAMVDASFLISQLKLDLVAFMNNNDNFFFVK